MTPSIVEVTVDPLEIPLEGYMEDADESAFEHAVGIATQSGLPVGSDRFNEIYLELKDKYVDVVDHMHYLLHTALLAVRVQLESGHIQIPVFGNEDTDTGNEMRKSVEELAIIVAASMAHVVASRSTLWVNNDEFARIPEASRQVSLAFAAVGSGSDAE